MPHGMARRIDLIDRWAGARSKTPFHSFSVVWGNGIMRSCGWKKNLTPFRSISARAAPSAWHGFGWPSTVSKFPPCRTIDSRVFFVAGQPKFSLSSPIICKRTTTNSPIASTSPSPTSTAMASATSFYDFKPLDSTSHWC